MNQTIQSQPIKDETEIRRLTEQWIDIWSPQEQPFTGEGFEQIFATGENEILVFDNFQDDVVVLRSLQEYIDTWKRLNNEWRLVHEHLTAG